MPKLLIIHGAGMNMRGKAQIEVFGSMTLPQYDEQILRVRARRIWVAKQRRWMSAKPLRRLSVRLDAESLSPGDPDAVSCIRSTGPGRNLSGEQADPDLRRRLRVPRVCRRC